MDDTVTNLLRKIPNVNECIAALIDSNALDEVPVQRIKYCVRLYLDTMRQTILSTQDSTFYLDDRSSFIKKLSAFILKYHAPRFTRVLNGTGVIVHTNLGRSLLPVSAMEYLTVAGQNYTNLELNLATGKRGSRYDHIDRLLCELTGAEAALVVNNNAAAVLIALETLARNKEVIVSRGQLVEIGGSFRIPDIMARSGARLVEVGATNRTHHRDYQQAITNETALFLRVHCSNYKIVGFTSEVPDRALVQLGREHGIPVMEDLGSGCLVDLSKFGLAKEPTVQDVVASGMDIVTFSGDKLLGGPQAGIIVGKKRYIEQIKRNPLNRALRIDKFTLAGLEAVLRLYLDESTALREIPTLAMIAISEAILKQRALGLLQRFQDHLSNNCSFELVQLYSRVGGGAMPEQNLASWGVAVQPLGMKINQLEKALRQAPVPVIGRVEDDRLLLDMRTLADDECDLLFESLRRSLFVEEMCENENYLTKGQ